MTVATFKFLGGLIDPFFLVGGGGVGGACLFI